MGIKNWPIWTCEVSEFPWTYDAKETCLILEGEVIVTPDDGQGVSIKAGDLVTFPAGMSCHWKVTKPIRKHYQFG
ncbi:MAG: cupin domain-containing protein [Desulfobulbaceae bacterium]|nr:cupin domain-containing protein [Desulfobulbaceae bacterium]